MFMNRNRYLIGRLLPWVAWMGIIFAFSSQSGEQVGGWLNALVRPFVPTIAINAGLLRFSLQKLAHFLEYAVLAALGWRALRPLCARRATLLTFCVSLIYAASDELHQFFVPGRGPSVRDVAIDGLGIVFGLAMLHAFLLLRPRRNTSPDSHRL